jgi:hypothetical protein
MAETKKKRSLAVDRLREIRLQITGWFNQWERIAARFGMTPSDRSRLRIEAPAAKKDKGAVDYFTRQPDGRPPNVVGGA